MVSEVVDGWRLAYTGRRHFYLTEGYTVCGRYLPSDHLPPDAQAVQLDCEICRRKAPVWLKVFGVVTREGAA